MKGQSKSRSTTVFLDDLIARGMLAPLDKHFAHTVARLGGDDSRELVLAAALASRAVQHGHVCADLHQLSEGPWVTVDEDPAGAVDLPAAGAWIAALRKSPVVADRADPENPRPLVLDAAGRLYLFRYAHYQQRLAAQIRARATGMQQVDGKLLAAGLKRLFSQDRTDEKQALAALLAVFRRFAVISGGPGTGKTYTVAKILALLQEQALAKQGQPQRILLLAPTGKAAQRQGESITDAVDKLDVTRAIKDAIPRTASTIHRALRYTPRTPTRFQHDARNPLPADVVLVDEASMVDIALMTKLFEAVLPSARLILLGDKDQLASVEAGAILGDIYAASPEDGFSEAFAGQVKAATGLGLPTSGKAAPSALRDCTIHLTHSHRYSRESGIGALAAAINQGDADAALQVLHEKNGTSLHSLQDPEALEAALGQTILEAFRDLTRADPRGKLEILSRFRILSAHRTGRSGAVHLNEVAQRLLATAGVLTIDRDWYDGRPLIITANDYQLTLFNGDIGVVARENAGDQESPRLAYFPGAPQGGLRALPPARLPPHETVFAMTVHKSQGSEFDHVALLLPDEASPILTRELIYTAVTRARKRVDIYGSEAVVREAISRRVKRASGLRDALA